MSITSTYDPETLAFLADQAQWHSGRKTYSPVPHSRIPSTPRPKTSPKPARAHTPRRAAVVGPTYLLSVPPGKEQTFYQRLHQHLAQVAVTLPLTFHNDPIYPGWLFLTIPDAVFASVAALLKEWRWGFLDINPIAPDLLAAIQSHQDDARVPQDAVGPFGDTHPLWQLAQALIHHYGWHGTWNAVDGWQLQTAQGVTVEHAGWEDLWRSLYLSWQAHASIKEIIQKHRAALEGVAFPITIRPGTAKEEWSCDWLGLSGAIPVAEHQGIAMPAHQAAKGWGVLLRSDTLQFSLVHQDLAHHLIAYRMPVKDLVRIPGQRTVLCVPQVSGVAKMHARQVSQSLGWTEPWSVVSPADPQQLIHDALAPKQMQFFRKDGMVTISGMPQPRRILLDRVNQWLAPEWTIVG